MADALRVLAYGGLLAGGLVGLAWMFISEYWEWRRYHGSSNDDQDDGLYNGRVDR